MKWFAKQTSKEQEIKLEFSTIVPEYVIKYQDVDKIKESLKWRLENALADEIIKRIATELDDKIVKEIAKELFENYDFKTPIQNEMQRRLEIYLRKL